MGKVTAARSAVMTLSMAAPLLAVAAMLSPAVAHADPVNDYVSRNGQTVCAALDKAHTVADILRLDITIERHTGFSARDAASAVGQSAATDCPWDMEKLNQVGDSSARLTTWGDRLPSQ
ncbi:DUF732 domain-containing protein [Mycobacterium sp.]|uniref:DUF732 domain-containing protein n=1 Tax=Mycobacterium sp. TaxID=1785 RepID=UPI003C790C72